MTISERFDTFVRSNSFRVVEKSRLVSKYFKNEFNLSGGHSHLVPAVLNPQKVEKEKIAVLDQCIRRADAQIIGISDVHLLLFKMGVWGSFGYIEDKQEEEYYQLSLLIDFLEQCGISRSSLYCTVCAGGRFLDRSFPMDVDSYNILNSLGINPKRIFSTAGRRNFMLSKGIDRLAGYNVEFFVKHKNGFVEIASSNIYQYINKLTYLEKTVNNGIGCGVGIERLEFLTKGYDNVYDLDFFQKFRSRVRVILGISNESMEMIADKIYRIAELSKTLVLLIDDEQGFDKTAQGKTMKTYLAKIVSELDFLSIPVDDYVSVVRDTMNNDYEAMSAIDDRVFACLQREIVERTNK